MRRTQAFALLAVLAFCVPSYSLEVDVFGNGDLGSTDGANGFTFNANNAYAIPFSTGSTSLELRELAGAKVLVGEETNAVTFQVAIFADAGVNEGPTGTALASGSLALGSNAPLGWQSVSFTSSVQLSQSANYYIAVLESSAFTGFRWREPTTSNGYSDLSSGADYSITAVATQPQEVWRRNGTTWVASTSSVATESLGFRLVAVPEPSTYALASIAATAFGLTARRKRRQEV